MHASCCPCAYHHPCRGHGAVAYPTIGYVPVLIAPVAMPYAGYGSLTVPHEVAVSVATSPQTALIGGTGDAHPSVEYVVAPGVSGARVDVTITSGGTTWTWSDTAVAAGYHVKSDLGAVAPGSTVTIKVTEATARLRWCETICC